VYIIEAAHNPEVAGSNPAPATRKAPGHGAFSLPTPGFAARSRSCRRRREGAHRASHGTANGRERGHADESAAVVPASSDQSRDATRRTRLANERTFLAWWRTGLTTFAVSVGAGKLVPELSSGAAWPFQAIGVAFALVGLLFMLYAYVRQKRVEDALARGEYAPFESRTGLIFTFLGVLLGIGTVAVVLAQPG
jgi:putative membrane protein